MSDLSADGENQGMEGFYRGDDGQGFTEADGKVLMWPHEEAVSNMIQVPTGYFPRVQKRRGPFDLEDRWTYTVDNAFAYGFFKRLDLEGLYTHPQGPAVSRLCEWCSTNRIMATNFERIVRISDLKDNETNCELCGMIYQSTDLPLRSSQEVVRIYRKDSNLWMDGWSRPILRLCAGLKSPQSIGIGFPILADVGSELHFRLIREWLRACDKDHSDYGCRPRLNPRLPTRVLKVGDDSSPPSLYCSRPDERGKYLALSHCWGILPQDVKENACTYRRNFEARCREIDVSTLPKNFQDAVLVTRKLGIRFVWIDSLCIVQDDDQDWDRESKLMEEVYGSAYCTIAASSAKDSTEGFLCPRDSASFVRVPYTSQSSLFVCRAIDDFHRDVSTAELSRRAWVLQERALSHRTIHFTKSQTYWECGRGIYCETMTKMNHLRTRLLGDPQFPSTIQENKSSDRIRFVQWIIELYTKLGLTFSTDRPKAFFSLESRLSRALRDKLNYGVLENDLHRSLLWQRPANKEMALISFPSGRTVPSWSWMAYDGELKFMDIPFGGVEWSSNVRWWSAAEKQKQSSELVAPAETQIAELEGLVRELSLGKETNGRLTFDDHNRTDITDLKCVIIGRKIAGAPPSDEVMPSDEGVSGDEGASDCGEAPSGGILRDAEKESSSDQEYYVLLVQPVSAEDGIFTRAGVGTLSKGCILFERPALKSRIV